MFDTKINVSREQTASSYKMELSNKRIITKTSNNKNGTNYLAAKYNTNLITKSMKFQQVSSDSYIEVVYKALHQISNINYALE